MVRDGHDMGSAHRDFNVGHVSCHSGFGSGCRLLRHVLPASAPGGRAAMEPGSQARNGSGYRRGNDTFGTSNEAMQKKLAR